MASIYDEIKPRQQGFAVCRLSTVCKKGQLIRRYNWTEEEKDYIRIEYRYSRESVIKLSREFGVTPKAIRILLSRLGLVKHTRLWLPGEEAYLQGNFDKLPTVRIARILKRSEGAVRHKAHRLKILKFERDGWFTLGEVCKILGVCRNWLMRRLNNGLKFGIRPFDVNRTQANNILYYISEKSLRDFIRRYPEELTGHNVDMVMLVDILAGIKVGNYEHCEEEA